MKQKRRQLIAKKSIFSTLFIVFIVIITIFITNITQAYAIKTTLTQPNGYRFKAVTYNDNGVIRYKTEKGNYPIIRTTSGYWVYAKRVGKYLLPTNCVVGIQTPTNCGLIPEIGYIPTWAKNPNFFDACFWKGTFTIGFLERPKIPAIWNKEKTLFWVWLNSKWKLIYIPKGQNYKNYIPKAIKKKLFTAFIPLKKLKGFETSDYIFLKKVSKIWKFKWGGVLRLNIPR